MPKVSYILTEDNLIHGYKGKLIDSQQYKATIYYDRPLFEYCDEEDYQYKIEVSHRDHEPIVYLTKDYFTLYRLLQKFDISGFIADISQFVDKNKPWKLQTPLKTYLITKNE